jgi:hypothetical protein
MTIDKQDFVQYEESDVDVKKAQEALQSAFEARSTVVQSIVKKYGVGPFEYKGRQLSAIGRKEKDEEGNLTGKETWYFKAPRGRVIKVD